MQIGNKPFLHSTSIKYNEVDSKTLVKPGEVEGVCS